MLDTASDAMNAAATKPAPRHVDFENIPLGNGDWERVDIFSDGSKQWFDGTPYTEGEARQATIARLRVS